jgi:hypothetical protein
MFEAEDQHLLCPSCNHYSNKVFVSFFNLRPIPVQVVQELEVAGFQYELPLQQKPPVACIGDCKACRHCDGK